MQTFGSVQTNYEQAEHDGTYQVKKTSNFVNNGGTLVRQAGNANGASLVDLDALTTISSGKKTVAVAGTAEALAGSTTIKSVTIKALAANTGNVYVGDSGVSSTNGFVLEAGETVSLDINNLTSVYIDVDTSGQGVTYIYLI